MCGVILGTDKIEIFRCFFDVVMRYRDTIEIFANKEGVKMGLLNGSHACFYDVFFDKEFFDVFEVDGAEMICIHITDLYKILKSGGNKEYLLISNDENYVTIKFEKDGNSRVFELVQAEDFFDSPPLPKIEYPCHFEVDIAPIKQSLKDISLFKIPSLNVVVDGESMIIATTESSMTKYSNTIPVMADGVAKSRYSATYLNDMIYFEKISNQLKIAFGDDMPFHWTSEQEYVEVHGLIAPLLDEGED